MLDHFGWAGTEASKAAFIAAIEDRVGHLSMAELERWRDDNLIAMLRELKALPG